MSDERARLSFFFFFYKAFKPRSDEVVADYLQVSFLSSFYSEQLYAER